MTAIGMLAICAIRQAPDLVANSRVLMKSVPWTQRYDGNDPIWLNPTTILYEEDVRSSEKWLSYSTTWYSVNVRTSRVRVMDGLSTVASDKELGRPIPNRDGKMILWGQRFGSDVCGVTDLNGRLIGAFPCHATRHVISSEEEESILSWSYDGRAVIESVSDFTSTPDRVQVSERRLSDLSKETVFKPLPNPDLMQDWATVVDDRKGNFIWVWTPPFGFGDKIRQPVIVTWPKANPLDSKRVVVTIPSTDSVYSKISPDRTHVLWILSPQSHLDSVWVTDIEGKQAREVGEMHVPTKQFSNDELDDIDWVPNGKAISFVYRHQLRMIDL